MPPVISERLDRYEDTIRDAEMPVDERNRYSRYCDFIYYTSSRTPDIKLAMRVCKPEKPGYILATTHGWHMTIPAFEDYSEAQSEYLYVEVDMRGRAFSQGKPDCNGWELYDIIDAVEYVRQFYAEYILDPSVVYFEAGSGGGGNAFAIAGKFPDYFAHISALCGISDYAQWYDNDTVGEFRDELDVWVGPRENDTAYRSRSGLTLAENLCSPMCIVHGETDIRVPSEHSRRYIAAAQAAGHGEKIQYWEIPGVGTRDHWGNATPEQLAHIESFCENGRQANRSPVFIPRRGKMLVGGYLFTKEFTVILQDIDAVAQVEYDLESRLLHVTGAAVAYSALH